MVLDLSGVRALVTGGTRGIGRAISLTLAASGARVAVNYRSNASAAEALGREMGERHFEHMLLKADVAQERSVTTMLRRVNESWGGLDLLVLNAGIWRQGLIGAMTLADWRDTIATNLTGSFIVINEGLRLMIESESPSPKRIILISSTSGIRGEAGYSHYSASKGGMISLTKSLAVELAPHGITVNAVAPGWIKTDMTAAELADPLRSAAIRRTIPLGRPGDPDEVAAAVVFLASRQASYITGEVLNVNGGSVLLDG